MSRTTVDVRLTDTSEAATPAQCRSARCGEHALTGIVIAALPMRQLSRMSRDELIRVIRAAEVPFLRQETLNRLAFLDRRILERLAFIGRRCCINRCCRN